MKYQNLFDEVRASDALRQRAAAIPQNADQGQKRHRIPKIALVAAVLALALTGSTLAAMGLPNSIPNWFAQSWEEAAQIQMTEEQAALIKGLTQTVGVSDTSGGVTVTLDSITVGDSTLWLLLRAEGAIPETEKTILHHFDRQKLEFRTSPDTAKTPGGNICDYAFVGETEDGVLTFLMRQTITMTKEDSLMDGHEAVLQLKDLMWSDSVAVKGKWCLSFVIQPVEREVLTLESVEAPVVNHGSREQNLTVELKDIQVTSTGIRFVQEAETAELHPVLDGVVLKDGVEISCGGGGSRWIGELYTGQWASDYCWSLPVEVEKIAGLRFGDTVIPLR